MATTSPFLHTARCLESVDFLTTLGFCKVLKEACIGDEEGRRRGGGRGSRTRIFPQRRGVWSGKFISNKLGHFFLLSFLAFTPLVYIYIYVCVCISQSVFFFFILQTGSGKTHTMEGGPDAETRGMIPRAVAQIFETATSLKSKGWEYTLKASVIEVCV